jgi:NitT/TauT family transport system permease protein
MGVESSRSGNFFRSTSDLLKKWLRDNIRVILIVVCIGILWQAYAQFIIADNNYFPSLWYVFQQVLAAQDTVIEAFYATTIETTTGFIFGTTIGFITGVLVSESYIMRRSMLPWIIFVYTVPAAIIAPLFLVWFGINLFAVALFVSLLSFYPVFISTLTGFQSVSEEYYHLGEISDASRWQITRHIKLWEALPHTLSGVKVGVQQSVVGAILAEFIASNTGLGFLIITSYDSLNIGLTFGTVFILMAFAIVYFAIVTSLLDFLKPVPDRLTTN